MTTIIFNKELFAKHLREFRSEKSQSEIADLLDTNRTTVSLLENSKIVPTLEIIRNFCEKGSSNIDNYFIKYENDPVILMMGKLRESDKPLLSSVIDRIKIRDKYISIYKRCEKS